MVVVGAHVAKARNEILHRVRFWLLKKSFCYFCENVQSFEIEVVPEYFVIKICQYF